MGRDTDEAYMRRAIALAKTAAGWTNPNPLVGAVIVKDGRIIGEGCHERYGQLHAERNALAACSESPEGATMYVTLEPCSHFGKQPPCADALVKAGIARVVVGSRDPNPLVSGKGNARLREAGIAVEEDFLREECDALNDIFFHYITTKTPYVVAKWAMSADGKIATHTRDARWVSGEASRAHVHDVRHRLAAIMVGVNTVLADNPLLTARRDVPSNQPVRVVCDSHLRIPLDCQLVQTAKEYGLIVACTEEVLSEAAGGVPGESARGISGEATGGGASSKAACDVSGEAADATSSEAIDGALTEATSGASNEAAIGTPNAAARANKAHALREAGVEVLPVPANNGRVSLKRLMEILGARGIDSVLLEGGSTLNWCAFQEGIVSELQIYVAPKLVGGTQAPGPVGGSGVSLMSEALTLGEPDIERVGEDVKLTFKVNAGKVDGRKVEGCKASEDKANEDNVNEDNVNGGAACSQA